MIPVRVDGQPVRRAAQTKSVCCARAGSVRQFWSITHLTRHTFQLASSFGNVKNGVLQVNDDNRFLALDLRFYAASSQSQLNLSRHLLHSEPLTRSAEPGPGASIGNGRLLGSTEPGLCPPRRTL